jgi:hypothetical protein
MYLLICPAAGGGVGGEYLKVNSEMEQALATQVAARRWAAADPLRPLLRQALDQLATACSGAVRLVSVWVYQNGVIYATLPSVARAGGRRPGRGAISIRSKVVTAAAALAIVAGLSATGTQTANAETRSCGPECIELSSVEFGTGYIVDVVHNNAVIGAPVTLAAASRTNQGEDFGLENAGLVNDFILAGLISSGLGPRWGNLYAFQFPYTPFGAATDLCLGLGAGTSVLTTVTLQLCSGNVRTLWIYDPLTAAQGGPVALISATTKGNFNHPVTLTELLLPGLPLTTSLLATPPAPQQEWHISQG